MKIKAIPTFYSGHIFRSRLEARWAVFFDSIGIDWDYEVEGYDLGMKGKYLPDFFLPQIKCFAEVKPDYDDKEMSIAVDKCAIVTRGTGANFLFLFGKPKHNGVWVATMNELDGCIEFGCFDWNNIAKWKSEGVITQDKSYGVLPFKQADVGTGPNPLIRSGITSSNCAKFEHGQSGLAISQRRSR